MFCKENYIIPSLPQRRDIYLNCIYAVEQILPEFPIFYQRENIGIGNIYGSWYNCKYQRAKHFQKRGEKCGDITFDDNTYANNAIKLAILKGLEKYGIHGSSRQIFKGFETCHIWPDTCYDARYHTSVANVVLLPREIAGLTDHCQAVEDLLKYEAWKRFGFKPDEADVPAKPKNYSKIIWRD